MKYILCLIFSLLSASLCAQTAAEAKALYDKGEYDRAKPAYKKLVKQQPANGNYNLWYGVCCLETGEAGVAVKYLETAVKKRIPTGQLYLGRAYNDTYRFEDAIKTFDAYIADLKKRKRDTTVAESLLEQCKTNLRMLKGVEQVCVIDSFVTSKAAFLDAYKISAESGKLFTYDSYFDNPQGEGGTVYETEMGNRLYYGEMQPDSTLSILSRIKQQGAWSEATPLPDKINDGRNASYPYVLTDGITIYYAADGAGSMGGYDIFVTRYNTNLDSYLTPENVGMPFNSPYNDYMYVIDEFNGLGWFASDRYQPTDSVCIYVFIPNDSKRVYNYEGMDEEQLVSLAQLRSISETWTDSETVEAARNRLQSALAGSQQPMTTKQHDFLFVIDDRRTYDRADDFRSPQALALFREYRQLEQELQQKQEELSRLRDRYAQADQRGKSGLTSPILNLELQVKRIEKDLAQTAVEVRRLEIND